MRHLVVNNFTFNHKTSHPSKMESPKSTSSSDHHANWKRHRCIGRGSFASVYLATNTTTNQTFAVKSTPLSHNSTQLISLNNEIQILKKLQNSSPYIIRYLGHDDTVSPSAKTFRNLHLEYLRNGTVAAQSKKTEQLVRSYTRCLLAALTHIHSLNIVHCDIKCQNVLVANKPGECKLADFGSAMEIGTDKSVRFLRGSPLWMAPEVLGGQYQGPESDVWSLGVTVVEMLTGKVDRSFAFSDQTPEMPEGVSELAKDFLSKCLRRERKERLQCEELMKHPFVAEVEELSLTWSNTPRCVLDEFEEKFDEMGNSSSWSETASLSSSSACSGVEKLCCVGGGPAWNDEGWMVVRKIPEYSDSVTERGVNEIMGEVEGLTENCETVTDGGGSERMGEVEGFECNLELVGLGLSGLRVCGYELTDVSGFVGVLCRWRLERVNVMIMMLLMTYLFVTNKCFSSMAISHWFDRRHF